MCLQLREELIYATLAQERNNLCNSGSRKKKYIRLRLKEVIIYATPTQGRNNLCDSGSGKK
jgi:hypothetical protein